MVEIKFLKELPVRSLNKSKIVQLNGADIYVDKDANRFAFFGFKNVMRSPMFSLYLVIKQYDSFGSFIRETKFSLPSIYAPHGNYVIEKPVRISDECEGCEVYVAYAEFATKQLYQDRLASKSHLQDFTGDHFFGAPTSVTCSINSNIVIQKEAAVAAPVEEKKSVEPFKAPEEAKVETLVAPVSEEVSAEENKPVFETKEEANESVDFSASTGEAKVRHLRRRLSFVNLIILGASVLAFAILATVLYVIF